MVSIPTGTFNSTTNITCISTTARKRIESDLDSNDEALNVVSTNALVDPWQSKRIPIIPPAQDEFYCNGPQISLTTVVEAHFVNALVWRTGEPDCVPLTTNLHSHEKLTSPSIDLPLLQQSNAILDLIQGVFTFPSLKAI